jgi:hypothetical protein
VIKPLSQAEKELLCHCGILSIAAETGIDPDTVADELDRIAAEGETVFRWNDEAALILIGDRVIAAADRRWLQLNAHRRGWEAN